MMKYHLFVAAISSNLTAFVNFSFFLETFLFMSLTFKARKMTADSLVINPLIRSFDCQFFHCRINHAHLPDNIDDKAGSNFTIIKFYDYKICLYCNML